MKTRTSFAFFHKTSLALAIVLALCGAGSLNASAASSIASAPSASPFATVARPTMLRHGDAVMGALAATQPVHVEVALKLRNKDVLDALIESNAKLQSQRRPPQLLTSAGFLANHAPTLQQAQAVANYLTSMGYRNVVIAPNRMLVSADGTAATARNAFMTTLEQVKTNDGRIAYANTDEVRIPAALRDEVLAVVGLQTVHQAHADVQARAKTDAAQTTYVMLHDPGDFPDIYHSQGGGNIPVGIVSSGSVGNSGGLNQAISDLDSYMTIHFGGPEQIEIVNTNGTNTSAGVDQLSDIASQAILSMIDGYFDMLIFYNIPATSDANLTADFNTIVASNQTKIIEDSFAICETDALADGSAAAQDAILEIAVGQGQTFAVSTGSPNGADQCDDHTNTPSWPASSQYVIAVGGTLLSASPNTWGSEQVYNASGGSPSTFEPMPSWQSAFGVPGTKRVGVDVVFDSYPDSGAKIIVDSTIEPFGSNVLAASLFAGAWASVLSAQGNSFGFAGPILYALPAADFHDVTVGNNSGGRPGLGYSAAPGYDFASGRGSMDVEDAIRDSTGLGNKPPVASFNDRIAEPVVYFGDRSTDIGGTIVAHAWSFGDGATSTIANPHHTYSIAATYTPTETVTNNDGATSTASKTLFVGPKQLMLNPGFEEGSESSPVGWSSASLFIGSNPAFAFDGVQYAYIENDNDFFQTVTIPATYHTATLSFYLWVADDEPSSTAGDFLNVAFKNQTNGQQVTLATFSNLDGTDGCGSSGGSCPPHYVLHTYDLTPYIGQKLQFAFSFGSSNQLGTVFYLDDITLPVQ